MTPDDGLKVATAAAAVRFPNYSWAELMKRVFLLDVLRCPCGGSRRRIATITEAGAVARILRCLGLVKSSPARGPPEVVQCVSFPQPASHFREPRLVLE